MVLKYAALVLLVSLGGAHSSAGDTAKSAMRCPLHHMQMVQAEVPILYGKPLISDDYSRARGREFPNGRERCVFGGCEPHATKKAKVLVCPKCNEARQHWLSEHQVKDARV